MKKLVTFSASIILSTSVLAGNMSPEIDIKSMHEKMNDERVDRDRRQDEDMQRLHKEMIRHGLSEIGMEARRKMIGTEAGKAYHQPTEKRHKKTAG